MGKTSMTTTCLENFGNKKATGETFVEDESGRWLKTGDDGDIRESPESGSEYVGIVDQIKELIKVNVSKI
jgi:long-subunit acyl-CoA synthetase (AMP-forming)